MRLVSVMGTSFYVYTGYTMWEPVRRSFSSFSFTNKEEALRAAKNDKENHPQLRHLICDEHQWQHLFRLCESNNILNGNLLDDDLFCT